MHTTVDFGGVRPTNSTLATPAAATRDPDLPTQRSVTFTHAQCDNDA